MKRLVPWFDPFFVAALIATPVLGALGQWLVAGGLRPVELLAGVFLSLTHGILALSISTLSVGLDTTRFLLRGLGFNGLRAAGLLGVLLWIEHIGAWEFPAFLVVALVGYFAFLFAEVLSLHRRILAPSPVRPGEEQGSWRTKQ